MCGTHAVSVFRQPENGFLDGLIASNAAQLEEGFALRQATVIICRVFVKKVSSCNI
jgi:hypothetical protein